MKQYIIEMVNILIKASRTIKGLDRLVEQYTLAFDGNE